MTFGQLGVVDATAFAFGLFMEIPSGAVSDLIGKRKTVIAAMLLSAIGTLTMAFSTSMIMLWIAFLIAQLGWALYSGAAEALAYDTLIDHGKEEEFQDVISTSGTIQQITSIAATLLGGILYAIQFRLSHLAWGLACTLGFLIAWGLTEPKTDSEHFTIKGYANQLKTGAQQLFIPVLRPFLLVVFTLLGVDYIYSWGLVKPAMATSFGFLDKEQAILYAFFGIVIAIFLRLIPTFRKMVSDKTGLFVLTSILALGFFLAFFPLGYWGIIPLFLIGVAGSLAYPWVSIVVNKEISSKYRATTLSTVALFTKLPYVLVAIIAGRMVENGTLNRFSLAIAAVCAFAIVVSGLERFLQSKKK